MKKLRNFFKGFQKGVMNFSQSVSMLVNSILFSIVYLVGVGLTSIVGRLSRKKFLENKLSKNGESYWSNLDLKKRPIKEYYKQF